MNDEYGKPTCVFSAGMHTIGRGRPRRPNPRVPRVWRASRATLEARNGGLRGLPIPPLCVPAEKLHFGVPFSKMVCQCVPRVPKPYDPLEIGSVAFSVGEPDASGAGAPQQGSGGGEPRFDRASLNAPFPLQIFVQKSNEKQPLQKK